MKNPPRKIRIGGASGYWGDTARGPEQLFAEPGLDYVVFDYLAEITMSILAKAKSRDPDAGYATDFVTLAMKPHLATIAATGIKVVANAGGLNLPACRRALEAAMREAGIQLRIATIEGDDLSVDFERIRDRLGEMDTGGTPPTRIMSANAYLGAFPIAAALDAGADIVITGRCVDSALVTGPLIHEFGWTPDDLDELAGASLAGHLLECGAQATGGNFTDWKTTVEGWTNTGFPIAEVSADGSFVLAKPAGTGGAVTVLTAAEQMLYEIGDPSRYVLPDVVCDFRAVRMIQIAPDRVQVSGARGIVPTPTYKVSITYADGHACIGCFLVAGEAAAEKARRLGMAILARVQAMAEARRLPAFSATALQVVGAESLFGEFKNTAVAETREVVLRLGIHHPSRDGAELFSREFIGAALSMAPGLTLLSPGRPKPSPVIRLFSGLVGKSDINIQVVLEGEPVAFSEPKGTERKHTAQRQYPEAVRQADIVGETVSVPLRRLAVARSGDKGDKANIGVVAREHAYLPAIRAALTPEAVKERFAHLVAGQVMRFDVEGIAALNFLLHDALGGGGTSSLNLDPQAKTYAQILLDMPVLVATSDAREWGLLG